jgi:hypothetical protein
MRNKTKKQILFLETIKAEDDTKYFTINHKNIISKWISKKEFKKVITTNHLNYHTVDKFLLGIKNGQSLISINKRLFKTENHRGTGLLSQKEINDLSRFLDDPQAKVCGIGVLCQEKTDDEDLFTLLFEIKEKHSQVEKIFKRMENPSVKSSSKYMSSGVKKQLQKESKKTLRDIKALTSQLSFITYNRFCNSKQEQLDLMHLTVRESTQIEDRYPICNTILNPSSPPDQHYYRSIEHWTLLDRYIWLYGLNKLFSFGHISSDLFQWEMDFTKNSQDFDLMQTLVLIEDEFFVSYSPKIIHFILKTFGNECRICKVLNHQIWLGFSWRHSLNNILVSLRMKDVHIYHTESKRKL